MLNTKLQTEALMAESSGKITKTTHVFVDELVSRLLLCNLTIADVQASSTRPMCQKVTVDGVDAWRRAEVDLWFEALEKSRGKS